MSDATAFRSLFELRGILEVEAAGLAAKRRSTADLEAMEAALTTMKSAPYGSVMWLKTDLEFHRTVAAATENFYMVQFLVFVSEKIRESILVSGNQQKSEALAEMTLGEHQMILDAIKSGDETGAQAAMKSHLFNAASRVGLGD
jgi:DNA-binding FadR family transcriptional regulator